MHYRAIIIGLLLIFLMGCTEKALHDSLSDFAELADPEAFNLNASHDMVWDAMGSCMAIICEKSTPIFPKSLITDGSLKEGNCTIEEIDYVKYQDLMETNVIEYITGEDRRLIRMFMYGAGTSSFFYDDANAYCNSSLKMAVKWLIADGNGNYPIGNKEEAECYLENDVIPVYVLYNKPLSTLTYDKAEDVAKEFDGVGPVVVVVGAEGDEEEYQNNIGMISSSLYTIKQFCPNCLTAAAVYLNGSEEYKQIEMLKSIGALNYSDFIAYGIDGRRFKECKAEYVLWHAMNFSRYVLRNYSKPTIIYYVLFDEGPNNEGNCEWTNITKGLGYSSIFRIIPGLVQSGVVGIALYNIYGVGPLGCKNCGLINPNTLQKEEPAFTSFFSLCQAYYTGFNENVSGVYPIVFSNGSRNCNYAFNNNMDRFINVSENEIKAFLPYTINKTKPFFTCGKCIASKDPPTTFEDISVPSQYCVINSPKIEIAAEILGMDKVLLRAVIWEESNFEECLITHYGPKQTNYCNPFNPPIQLVVDFSGQCQTTLEQHITQPSGVQQKACKFGAAQTTDLPAQYYIDNGVAIPDSAFFCGGEEFSPFEVFQSACSYAYKFIHEALPNAKNLVSSNEEALGVDEENREWFEIFFALDNMYLDGHQDKGCHAEHESQEDWIEHFEKQKNGNCVSCSDGSMPVECCNNDDFFSFIKYCEHGGGKSYAYDILAKYVALLDECENLLCTSPTETLKIACENDMVEEVCCNYIANYNYNSDQFCNSSTPTECAKYCPNP